MKVLLTIEQYRTRILNLVKQTARQLLKDGADDYFKFKVINDLCKQCVTFRIASIDQVNQLFFKVFYCDKEGKPFTEETLSLIDKKEADEFNSQKWFADFYEKRHKNYEPCYKISPINKNEIDLDEDLFHINNVICQYWENNTNEPYYIAKEVFKELYGYEFSYNYEWKFLN